MTTTTPPVCIERADFGGLLSALKDEGYALVGPRLKDGSISFDDLEGVDSLPEGWGDVQDAGTYRVVKREDKALFGYNSGPHSWKKYLYPARERLWSARKSEDGFVVEAESGDVPKYAFIGVRACDLHAIEIQDKVFMSPEYADPRYGRKREKAFILAVNCGLASRTCFCASMKTGPKNESGFDIAVTEVIEDARFFSKARHYFVAEAGSERGAAVLAKVKSRPAVDADLKAAAERTDTAKSQQVRHIDMNGIRDLFYNNYESPIWNKVAERCLSCANCTMVCPTCFCSNTEDITDLTGDHAERWREWDSCFTLNFSYIHGGEVRPSPRARYRQWITHKMAAWIDQFGTAGCVGCGRCIAWCPVGIDITEEAQALRQCGCGESASSSSSSCHKDAHA